MDVAFYFISIGLSFLAVLHLLVHKREPASTLSWLLFVLSLPILGPLFYFFFGPQRLERRAIKRRQKLLDLTPTVAPPNETIGVLAGESEFPVAGRPILRVLRQISEYGVTWGNEVELLADPARALVAMQEAIDRAERYIHLEYYIISSDEVTEQLFDGLHRALARGVEVRILYDTIGSLSLKRWYFRKLVKGGARVAGFLPLTAIFQRFNLHFRNHRKLLIVDGRVVFTGGANIGKEYLGRKSETQWRDYTVKVRGPVCGQLEDVFARDWHFTTEEDLFQPHYYPPVLTRPGNSTIQPIDSGPDTTFQTLHQAIFMALNAANEEILLTTPYFVPDHAMMCALFGAALRGVKIRLLLPAKSDSFFVRFASRSFYDSLLKAGVEIYEYQPTMLHAKMIVIDRKWTILGSANMDIRSFRLNFELNLLIYGVDLATQGSALFQSDLVVSKAIELHTFERRSVWVQMLENGCRLLSPIL